MDSSVDPCTNFYDFACGNFLKNTVVKAYKLKETPIQYIQTIVASQLKSIIEEPLPPNLSRPYQLLKDVCNLCYHNDTEKDGLKTIMELIGKLGRWPLLEGTAWDSNTFDWTEMLIKLSKVGLPYSYLFDMRVEAMNNSHYCIFMTIDNIKFAIKLKERLHDIVMLFNLDLVASQRDIDSVFEFKTLLQSIVKDPNGNEEVKTTVTGLEHIIKGINWLDLMKSILNRQQGIQHLTIITQYKLLRIVSLINTAPKRAQANYVFFETILWMFHYAEDNLRYIGERISASSVSRGPRWYQCIEDVYTSIDLPLYSLYVKKHLENKTKEEVEKLVTNIRTTLLNQIQASKWVDESTKIKALEKANAMRSYVGYPSELGDSTALEKYYEKLSIDTTSYLKSIMKINVFNTRKQFDALFNSASTTIWQFHKKITDVNAYYKLNENTIDITAAILQKLFFGNNRPSYMNYGQIGMIIGHEMMHAFDDMGRTFDQNGNIVNWWTEKSKNIFEEKSKCLVEQYQNYTFPKLTKKLDGWLTLGENIADNIGLEISHLSYKRLETENGSQSGLPGLNYTQSQLFWISFAQLWCEKLQKDYYGNLLDTHSPGRYRVIGSVSNLKEFAQDFNCPLNSPMNPSKKCQFW
ncbi:neprilysin-2-like [Photinus pyralis]|uniref:neprilysin-2-like n=1 Tax=Photinus pyralis TaxID=7054 RepID=UPI00126729A4|nr:neprilysin-2-like [Photinus pyralis]